MAQNPDFICIGAQRGGTTWLYRQLQRQPKVWLPPVKEVHYFDRKGQAEGLSLLWQSKRWRGEALRQTAKALGRLSLVDLWWIRRFFLDARTEEWYRQLFNPGTTQVCGDLTPAYSILNSDAVAEVHALMPEVKILFIMRDPVKRAWSHAIKGLVFDQGIAREQVSDQRFIDHFESDFSRLRGNYIRTLDIWQGFFPEEQLFIAFMEDIVSRPSELIEDICGFLGVASAGAGNFAADGERTNAKAAGHDIPEHLRLYLSRLYRDEIATLAVRCGETPARWLADADVCITAAESPRQAS